MRPGHRTTIEQDEPALMLDVIAETVIEDAERLIGGRQIPRRAKAMAHLANYANAVYKANDRFAKKVRGKGNVGRDTLYVFMEHWLASWLKKNAPTVFRRLPRGYGFSYSPFIIGQRQRAAEWRSARRQAGHGRYQ